MKTGKYLKRFLSILLLVFSLSGTAFSSGTLKVIDTKSNETNNQGNVKNIY